MKQRNVKQVRNGDARRVAEQQRKTVMKRLKRKRSCGGIMDEDNRSALNQVLACVSL